MLFLKNFLQQNEPVCPRFWAVSDLVVGDPFHSRMDLAKSQNLKNQKLKKTQKSEVGFLGFWDFAK